MRKKNLIKATCIALTIILGLAGASAALAGPNNGGGNDYANGPFTYVPGMVGETTFLGTADSQWPCSFKVYAPSGGSTFPPAGGNTVTADIRVFEIKKVVDGNGDPLVAKLDIPLDSPLGSLIAAAFSLSLNSNPFTPGSLVGVDVTVNNPRVANEADYGDYEVVIKAQSPGNAVGVGSGSRFTLKLRAAALIDDIPPTVQITSPLDGSAWNLGPVDIDIIANDPAPGSGVQSISANVMSDGGLVKSVALTTTSAPLPVAAGVNATAAGIFMPFGGTGSQGTTSDSAFTSSLPSGIGTYTLNASATDVAGNTGTDTAGFTVNYDIQFSVQKPDGKTKAAFEFTVKRSTTTSDGASMYDQTVVVKLIKVTDESVVATHVYHAGGPPKDYVIIDETVPAAPVYKTQFENLASGSTYQAKVYFLNVDKVPMFQAESIKVTTK